ncbi:MAG: CheR family methyltransferase [Thermoguttaceae bacterium]|jgi:chemotaxis protein methyltransferase WspC
MPFATDEILAEVFQLLQERAGMAPELFGVQGIAHAVHNRFAASGAESPQDYINRLASDSAVFQELLDDLLVRETWMFRDAHAFRSVERYFDAWQSRRRGQIRVLSVACSTGEEVYSLAIALRKAGLEPSQFQILGTDLSRRSLELARSGNLNSRSFREPDDTIIAMRDRWCEQVGQSWRVRDDLRDGLEFRWGNLAQAEFLACESPFHVIFCRNVLIYFHSKARRMAVRHLHRLLSPEGILYSAPAEARIFSEAGFRSLDNECPFAFQCPGAMADTPQSAAVVMRPQQKNLPPFDVDTDSPKPATKHAFLPLTSSGPLGQNNSNRHAPSIGVNTTQEDSTGQAILHAAQQAANNGRLEEADALCGQVLSQNPSSTEAHYLRGVVFQAQGMLNEAQRSLEKTLYLDPRHYQALVHMMLLSEQRGDQSAMANYRRRARQAAPREAE